MLDPRNLFRDADRIGINLRMMTGEQIEMETLVCSSTIIELNMKATGMRREHLRQRQQKAKEREDKQATREIAEIIRRLTNKKRWDRVNWSTRKPKGGQVLLVRVKLPKGRTEEVVLENDMFDRVSTNLSNRF